jgi:hypothetical protein
MTAAKSNKRCGRTFLTFFKFVSNFFDGGVNLETNRNPVQVRNSLAAAPVTR